MIKYIEMDTYQNQKFLEAKLRGDTTPTLSNLEILGSLKLISQLNNTANIDNTAVEETTKEELRYLNGAMDAIANNQILRDNFGSGYQAAQNIAGLLKSHAAKIEFDAVMDNALARVENRQGDPMTRRNIGAGARQRAGRIR